MTYILSAVHGQHLMIYLWLTLMSPSTQSN